MLHKRSVLIILAIILVVIGCKNRYAWFQTENTVYLIDINQSSRVFPHRVDTIGKLQDIWDVGFRSFETDVYFDGDHFNVGHDSNAMSGNTYSQLLSSINYSQIERIWLDFKNLDSKNYNDALEHLKELDKKYKIKKKIIIETGLTSDFFNIFKEDGWHTSFYLPTEKILKLLKDNNIEELNNLASDFELQSKEQNLSAFSFDDRLYPFVKQYLEPIIDESIVYHTWWGPNIYRYNFQNKLKKDKLFLDKRVKTILVRFKSKHHL